MSLIAKLINKTFTYTEEVNPPFAPTRWVHQTTNWKFWDNWERMFFGTDPFSYGREELRSPFYWEYED